MSMIGTSRGYNHETYLRRCAVNVVPMTRDVDELKCVCRYSRYARMRRRTQAPMSSLYIIRLEITADKQRLSSEAHDSQGAVMMDSLDVWNGKVHLDRRKSYMTKRGRYELHCRNHQGI